MGKLSPVLRDKNNELNDVDQILFQDVINCFCKKYKEDSYKQPTEAQSIEGEKSLKQGRTPKD